MKKEIDYNTYFTNKEDYEIIEINKVYILYKHKVCETISKKTKSNFRQFPYCSNKLCKENRRKQILLEKYGVDNVAKLKLTQEKIKKTCLKKYGFENASKNEEIKNKIKTSNKDFYEKNEYLKKRMHENNPMKNNDIKNKVNKTNIKKYGHIRPAGNKDIQNKIQESVFKKHGVKIIFQKKEIIEKAKSNRKKSIKFKESFYNNIIKNYKECSPLFSIEEYDSTKYKSKYKWKCKKCLCEFNDHIYSGHLPRCPVCYPKLNGVSIQEKQLQDWLFQYINIENNKRFKTKNNKQLELDIYIPEKNIGIELNGIYWHSENGGNPKNKNYHINKTKYFENKDIQLLHFWDIEWINKQNIVKSIISNKLNLTENRIYARKCIIKIVEDYKPFLNNNHLQGEINSSINIGLYYNNELVSLLNIGKSRNNKKYQYEIYRYCNKLNTNVVGGFSKLFKYFINNYNPLSIITYADRRYSNGGLYKNNGFILSHISTPNYFYTKNYTFLESRNKYQKHKLKDLLENFDNELTEWENMQLNGYDRIWDCGNYVYIWNK